MNDRKQRLIRIDEVLDTKINECEANINSYFAYYGFKSTFKAMMGLFLLKRDVENVLETYNFISYGTNEDLQICLIDQFETEQVSVFSAIEKFERDMG